jgi:hypothetical protein
VLVVVAVGIMYCTNTSLTDLLTLGQGQTREALIVENEIPRRPDGQIVCCICSAALAHHLPPPASDRRRLTT